MALDRFIRKLFRAAGSAAKAPRRPLLFLFHRVPANGRSGARGYKPVNFLKGGAGFYRQFLNFWARLSSTLTLARTSTIENGLVI